ncbi:MAG: magnesium/cobalt transporter CorA, partial [Myxococcales bacterium]|nr:magnesium/cobalt transporter CorA [Myxococcales bacterium]
MSDKAEERRRRSDEDASPKRDGETADREEDDEDPPPIAGPGIHRRESLHAPPGTLLNDPDAPPPVITVIGFGPSDMFEKSVASAAEAVELIGREPVVWINVDGVGRADIVGEFGALLDLHRLAQEDVLNVHQRPKVEEYPNFLYIVLRTLDAPERPTTEQLSLFLAQGWLLTFQETPGDSFDSIRRRIREHGGRIRRADADYLAYALIDAAIDAYFPIIEHFAEDLDEIEEEILDDDRDEDMGQVYRIKRELLSLQRAVWPLRDNLAALARDPNPLVAPETRVYFRDCLDHLVRILDLIQSCQQVATDLTALHVSMASHRMNEVMKVLTIIATIFIPLSFIAGVYGM